MSDKIDEIEILLATYNGEKYLPDLLESIENQSHTNWILRVSDDNSKDATVKILKQFKEKYPDRVTIEVNLFQLGAAENFISLMTKVNSEIVAFCDQDDVWYPNKLHTLLVEFEKLIKIEGSSSKPILVYSDAVISDQNLNTIHESLFQFHYNSDPKSHTFERLKFKNCITGCTVLTNQAAIKLALICAEKMNTEADIKITMHDHWLGLVVAKNGGLFQKVYEPLLIYRQHSNNAIGAQKEVYNLKSLINKYKGIRKKYAMVSYLENSNSFLSYCFQHIYKKLMRKI